MEKLYLKNHKKSLIWILSSVGLTLIVLMLIGTFFDYQIANFVAVEQHGFLYYAFGVSFEFLAFWPAILVNVGLFTALALLFKKIILKILFYGLSGIHMIGGVFGSVFFTLSNHDHSVSLAISLPISFIIGIALTFLLWFLMKRLNSNILRRVIYILVIGAIVALTTNLLAFILQVFWGRYRFYVVYEYGAPFQEWFRPMGRGGSAEDLFGSNSFPSIHSASVSLIAILIPLGWAMKVKRPTQISFIVVAVVMFICGPFARMVLSWHYLTDVVFSLIIALLMFIITLLVVDYLFKKQFEKFIIKKY